MLVKLTMDEIDSLVRPLTEKEAYRYIGDYIKKRPGVFSDDDGSVYRIIDVKENGFVFWEKDVLRNPYKFENLIYDFLFENDNFIGVKK